MTKFVAIISVCLILTLQPSCKKNNSGCPTINVTATITNSDGTNGVIAATATGSSGFTYSKDGITFGSTATFNALVPGSYTITAKDSKGCTGAGTFTVNGTKTYFITKAPWKFSSATASGFGDISSQLQTCQKDNILTFAAGGTGTNDEGLTKCNAGDPQSNPFTWSLISAETQLQVSSAFFTGGSNTFTIVSITATQMVLSQQIVVSGLPLTVTVTFIH